MRSSFPKFLLKEVFLCLRLHCLGTSPCTLSPLSGQGYDQLKAGWGKFYLPAFAKQLIWFQLLFPHVAKETLLKTFPRKFSSSKLTNIPWITNLDLYWLYSTALQGSIQCAVPITVAMGRTQQGTSFCLHNQHVLWPI